MNTASIWRPLALFILALTTLGAFAPRAQAQVNDLEPFWVVLTRDTELRCGDSPSWYAISNLKQGQLLRVNAESFDWYRVSYPKGTRVWIDTRDARIVEDGARIETVRNAAPRAINAAAPTTESSYRRVNMESVVPPGTKYRYFGPIMNNQNQVDGYIVPAPEGANGFVIADATRRATAAEVEAFLAEQNEAQPKPAEEEPEATDPEQDESEQPSGGTDTEGPADAEAEQGGETPVESEETVEPDTTETETSDATDAVEDDAPDEPQDDASTEADDTEAESLTPMEAVIQRSRQLDEAYGVVAAQKTADAEIRPLIQEYRGLITLAADTPLAEDVARYAETRIELLNIRLELQQALEELAAIRAAKDETAESFNEIGEALAGRRDYIVVGRLVPSAIYNGKRLPLMYRLQSVEGGSGRTLAYVTPNEDIEIDSMLNAIVGVAGAVRPQSNSGVRIIEPTVIDVLRPGS